MFIDDEEECISFYADKLVSKEKKLLKHQSRKNTNLPDPYNVRRLYGDEKYCLNNMELNSHNFPEVERLPENLGCHSIWSDRIFQEWNASSKNISSIACGDAFWSKVSSEDLLLFGNNIAKNTNLSEKITGVRIVRFTDAASQYPVLRVDLIYEKNTK